MQSGKQSLPVPPPLLIPSLRVNQNGFLISLIFFHRFYTFAKYELNDINKTMLPRFTDSTSI